VGPAAPFHRAPRGRAVAAPPKSTAEREIKEVPLSLREDGLELQQRRWSGRRGRRGSDDAGRAVPDQRGAGGAALQVPQGAPGPPRRPQPRGLISIHAKS
jgi:hypothetical protein